ncbi:glycosyltransferase family 92 protein [Desulfovibrio sp. OttesenSCG-928-A18]|nr:glycosyltransferase family 92 protein [Desulfovibrio sp. OttesenSCG-928-A18]
MTVATPRYYLGLCAIARDETPFLREWVAYHYRIGFEKIYIYDNESPVPVRESVSEFYELGVCDTYTLRGEAMQNIAYNLCLRDHGHEFEWLAFFDLDEFLCLKYDTDARVLLRDYEAYSGLALQWDVFSSSGHIARPEGMVTLNYTQSLGYSYNGKCIVRPARVKMTVTAHHFLFHDGFAVNTKGEPALGAYSPVATDKACLNHYSYRSQRDFAQKLEKGDATYGANNPRRWEQFYAQAQSPVQERTDILPLAREVRSMLEAGSPAPRYDVNLCAVQGLALPELLAGMGRLLGLKQTELAEVLFALAYKSFSGNVEFLRLGIALCLNVHKTERALALARQWLARAPDENAYLACFECFLAAGDRKEAQRMGAYLAKLAKLMNNAALLERVQDLARRHGAPLEPEALGRYLI